MDTIVIKFGGSSVADNEKLQKVADKTPVKMAVELPDNLKTLMKEYKAEIKSLSQLKKNPSEKKTQKLLDYDKQYAKLRKKYKDNDKVKEFDKFLGSSEMPKIRIQAKKTAAAQEKALREQEKIANEQIKEAKQQKGKSTSTTTDNKTKLKEEKQKIINNVNEKRAKQEVARQNVQKAYIRNRKATEFVEGKVEDGQTKPGMKQMYEDVIAGIERYKEFTMEQTSGGQNKKAVSFWGDPKDFDKFIDIFQGYIDKGMADYNNRDELVPKAKKEYEDVTKNLEALETESVKRLEEINKLLGPIEKISIDSSKLTPKVYQDLFKESLPPKKFKLRKRTLTDDVADAAINRDYLKTLHRGDSSAGARKPGADTQMGMRQSIMDGPYVDKKRIIRTAIGGPYADTNSYVRNAIKTQKASYKLAKETLEKFIVELNKLQEVIDQRNAEANAKAEAEGRMSIAGKGRNKNEITEQEKNIALSQMATEEVGRQAKNISKGKSTADVKAFEKALKSSFGFLTRSFGPSIWKPLEQNINRILANFDGGTFKITDDTVKGEGKNYAQLAKLLSEYFDGIDDFFKQNPEMEQLAKMASSLKNAAKISTDAYEEMLKNFDSFLRKFKYNPGRTSTSGRSTSTQNKNESPVTGNTNLAKFATEANKNLEKNTTFTKMGNVVQEENAEANKLNANTGTDSEAGKNEIVEATEDVGTTIKNTFSSGNGENGGNGGNDFGEGDIGDTGPSILEQIRDILMHLDVYTAAIFDLLPKLKLTIKREKRSKKKDESIPESDSSLYPVVAGELKDRTEEAFQAIREAGKTIFQDNTDPAKLRQQQAISDVERAREEAIKKNKQARYSNVGLSQDISTTTKSLGDIIKKAFGMATATTEVDRIKNLNQSQREKELAELTKTYGIADRDRNITSTGDKGRAFRMKSVYGYRQKDANPFKDLKLTPGLEVDTKGITDALQTMIEKNMFSAQTGVSGIKDIIKLSFGGIGMPSLEKSRAQADAANEILSIIRQAIQELLQAIQGNETTLRGFEASGDAKFDDKGQMVSGSNEAWTAFDQLEEQKSVLNGLIAELTKMDQLSAETGGNMTEFFKVLGFVSPELRKCNTIIGNINAGLDKNGKALKFQKRFQETLNYSFQLLTRHIGQMIKGWLMMLNPINLIKKSFSDFASYDTKWQRTMNVIKYNFRRIIRPAMEWIAQQFVNIIGLANALIKGIGSAFGQNWDLFDKDAAEAEKIREDLEAAGDVTLGFDELHDVGSDNTGANDLSGDIYTPQWTNLYDTIENFGEKIGNVLAGIRKLTEGWNFWTWLAVIGGALIGLKVLKWLINIFGKGKNPLKSVADGLSFLEKAVGWAILIWAFTEFVKALKDFIDVVGHMKPEEVKQAMIALAEGIGILVGAIVGLEIITAVLEKFLKFDWKSLFGLASEVGALAYFVDVLTDFISTVGTMEQTDVDRALDTLGKSFKTLADAIIKLEVATAIIQMFLGLNWESLFGIAALVGAFALFTDAMAKFAEAIKGLTNDDVINGLKLLGGAFLELVVAIGLLAAIASIIPITAVPVLAVFALVIAAVALLVLAMSEFVKALHDNGEDVKLFLEGIAIVLRAFGDVVVGILSTIGDFIINLLSTVGNFIIDLLRTISGTIIGIIIALLEGAANIISSTLEGIATIITSILNGIVETFRAIGDVIRNIIEGIAVAIATIVKAIADGIRNVLQPILDFIDSVIGKVTELAKTIVHEIGETIRTVIQTTGEVIIGIVDSLVSAIPRLLDAILRFVGEIGPAVENSCDAIMRTITKLINFVVSGIEYLVNTLLIDSINGAISTITFGMFGNVFSHIEIDRFYPQYEQGTNYVPNDGLAYLHQGEAVVPKKYNQPYQQGLSAEERAYMDKMIATMNRLDGTIAQGINVKGEFRQRGNDLVATVEKNKNRQSNTVLNNKVYAR